MAKITATVPVDADWTSDDVLRLTLGEEDAVNLAASAATTDVADVPAKLGAGTATTRQLEAGYYPTPGSGKVAILPLGVAAVDSIGNVSELFDTFAQLNDPPDPPHAGAAPGIAATANPGEATISWDASADVDY
ncbi:MAG: hypothetical protein IT445_03060 [Phycisphaeraceae bacterium]|nr:hypothetical protein [Phycisphaeraceae bacterium]